MSKVCGRIFEREMKMSFEIASGYCPCCGCSVEYDKETGICRCTFCIWREEQEE
jgi:hypothetical protein